ncbi:VCBS [Rhodopseudomonas palustris HaA2]|uniref:VCBS n=1 Tax=Rhodopseudomonas palustris (strain HaA2) TaxID=316058 RepID=Q2IZL4_RHOP2|nr:VCBS domain-containing protein [Rhodopseudomonas palustris]ABD06346.1 VCBS [Rhodopseudomonas palustris HaA2]
MAIINGTNGNDNPLVGSTGADTIHGLDGDDLIRAGNGNDTVFGDAGDDILDGGTGFDVLTGGAGNDALLGGSNLGGLDIAAYSGKWSDYTITVNAAGNYTVVDRRAGSPDGTDTVSGVEAFRFAAPDGNGTVDFLLADLLNAPPVAGADVGTVAESAGTPTSGNSVLGNVLGNDSDPNAPYDVLSVSAIAGGTIGSEFAGSFGKITLNADGSYTYVVNEAAVDAADAPAPGTTLTDQFTYTLSDAGGLTQTATLTITITGTNDAPVAQADTLSSFVTNGAARTIAFSELTANDSAGPANEADQTFTVTGVSNASGGTVTINNNGTAGDTSDDFIQFTPDAGFNGTASFDYTITDNGTTNGVPNPLTSTGHVSFSVTSPNHAPQGEDAVVTISEDGAHTFQVSDFAFSDADLPAQTLNAVIITSLPAAGSLTLNGTPVTAGQVIAATSIPGLVFTPAPDANGAGYASFTFQVRDSGGTANGGVDTDTTANSFTFNVTPVNDGPVAANPIANQSSPEDQQWTFQVPADAFSDIDSPSLNYSATLGNGDPLPGTLVFDASTRTFSGSPPQDYNGTFSLKVTASDGTLSVSDIFELTITPMNDAAIISGDVAGAVDEDTVATATGTLLASDVDNATNAFQANAGSTTHGSYVVNAAGVWTYTLNNADTAVDALNNLDTLSDSFTVLSADGTSQVVSITITGTNDAAIISGTATGAVDEDTVATATGTLLASDVDNAANAFQANAGSTTHGSYVVNAAGVWTYTLNNADTAVDALNNLDTLSDSFTVLSADGTSQVVSITITGTNDAAIISGDVAGAVDEDTVATATGTLLASDVDNATNAFQANAGSTTHGSYVVNAAGVWTYTLDNTDPAVNALNNLDTLSDSFTVLSADGTSQVVSITITGTNDAAIISGTATGAVDEDTVATATGTLLASDVDNAANAFQANAGSTTHGSYVVNAAGVWTYTLDNTDPAVNALNNLDTLSDSFTVLSADGTSQVVSITITGTNDAAIISGDVAGAVDEDTVATATGTLLASDVDNATNAFQANAGSTTHGSYVVNAAGVWTYTLDNADTAVDALNNLDTLSDSFTVLSADGTSQVVSITITGTNDAAIISGTATGAVDEDTVATATGTLLASDVDNAANAFQANAGSTTHGSYVVNAAGVWTYTLDNADTAVDALNNLDTLSDSFTVLSADGTSQVVSITITGTNDAAIISGTATGAVDEDTVATATGTLLASDVDNAANAFQANAGSTTHGSYVVNAAGVWTYTLDNADTAVDALNNLDTLSDSFTVLSADGTSQVVSITITGTNDAAIISGTATGAVDEDTVATATGTLLASDVDNAANAFQANAGSTTHGSYVVNAAGVWTYTLNNADTAVDALNNLDTLSDSFTVLSADGTSQVVSITITGTNDAAIISGDVAGAVDEDTVATATGTLLASDVDNATNAFQANAGSTTHGSYVVDGTGTWTYTLNNADPAVNALNDLGTLSDSFTVLSADGTSQVVSITITGTNDAAIISGTATGAVDEDTVATATGTLLASDVDNAANAFQANAGSTTHGSYVVNAAGVWTYTLDNTDPAVNALNDLGTLSDSFTVLSADGTSQVVSITITGTNDAAIISGTATGAVDEDTVATATGTLTASDVDNAANVFQANAGSTTHGSYAVTAAGVWTYTLDNTDPAVNALNDLGTLSDSFTVLSADGTSQVVSITITGTNDAAIISGTATGAVDEDTVATATGTLLASDVDNAANAFQANAGSTTHGSYVVDGTGTWTYTLDNTDPAVNALNDLGTLSDSFTVLSADGTSQVVSITITGTNDAAIISGTATGAVDEDTVATATGTLTASDVDNAANAFQANAGSTTHGSYVVDGTGVWTYTLNNADTAVDALNNLDTLSDSFTVLSADGTSQVVSITITGTNDAAIISGDVAGAVDEDTVATATGTLLASDVDNATNAFQANAGSTTHGSYVVDGTGTWTYTLDNTDPAVNALNDLGTLSDSFTVLSADGTSQVVSITITGTNDAPVIDGDPDVTGVQPIPTQTVAEDGTVAALAARVQQLIAGGISDVDGEAVTLTLTLTYPAGSGIASQQILVNPAVDFTWTPPTNFNGTIQVDLAAFDGTATTHAGFDLVVTPVNDAPVLTGSAATLAAGVEDTTYTVSAADLLAGFTDVDGDTLSVADLSANHGVVTDNGDGTYTIAPTSNYNGPVTLSYNVVDGQTGVTAATQTFALAAAPDLDTVLTNAALDPDVLDANGNLHFGSGNAGTGFAVATDAVDAPGVELGLSAVLRYSGTAPIDLTLDPTGHTYVVPAGTAGGTPQDGAGSADDNWARWNFSFSIGADADMSGNETIGDLDYRFTISSIGESGALTELLSYTVAQIAEAYDLLYGPGAGAAFLNQSIYQDTINLEWAHILGSDPNHPFDPNLPGYYQIDLVASKDGSTLVSDYIKVRVNSAPDAQDDVNGLETLKEAGVAAGDAAATGNVLTNDADPDTLPTPDKPLLVVTQVGVTAVASTGTTIDGTYGTLTIAANGAWSYALDDALPTTQALQVGLNGTETFTYTVADRFGVTDTATLTLSIDGSNDAPVAYVVPAFPSIAEDASFSGTVGLNLPVALFASDVDNALNPSSLTFTGATITIGATVINVSDLAAAGIDYTPGSGVFHFNGAVAAYQSLGVGDSAEVVVSFTATDGSAVSNAGSVSFTVTGTNDAPTTSAVTLTSVAEDSGARLITQAELLDNAVDIDGDILTATGLTIASGKGTLVNNTDGTWSYTPAANDDTVVSFSYTIVDGHTGSVAGSATLDITPVNDAPTLGFRQGFEDDSAGIIDGLASNGTTYGHLAIVNTFQSASGTVSAADGGDFAVFTQAGPLNDESGPFTRFDGYRSEFVDGLTTSVKVYLDTNLASGEGFDYSVAANRTNGNHLRDYIFHVTKDSSTGQLLVGASNNTNFNPREDLDTLANHGTITSSGWYTLQYVFRDNGGVLAVELSVLDSAGAVVFTQTLSSPSDLITDVGGNRYGWFTNIDVTEGIAVDSFTLGDFTGKVSELAGTKDDSATIHRDSGIIPLRDVDLGDSHTVTFLSQADGYLGSFSLATADSTFDGEGKVTWTFQVADSALDALKAGEVRTQSYTVTVDDGNGGTASQVVSVTLTGANDGAVVGGTVVGSVTEDGDGLAAFQTTGGTLTVDDKDAGESFYQEAAANTAYGSYTLAANGEWVYTLANGHAAVQSLAAGESLTDSFTARTIDGTLQTVTITINGANDITSTVSGSVDNTATKGGSGNELIVGTGIPASGFGLVNQTDFGIELGLQVIYRQGPTVAPTDVDGYGDGVLHFTVNDGAQETANGSGSDNAARAAWSFNYSIATGLNGESSNLGAFTFKLLYDVDPTESANYKTLTMVSKVGGGYEWLDEQGHSIISDDGGNANVAQNSENYAFSLAQAYLANVYGPANNFDGDARFDIQLQAYSGATLLATNHIAVDVIESNTTPVAVADSNAHDQVIEGGVSQASDITATGNVLTNDVEPDIGDTKTATLLNGVAVGATGTVAYGTYGNVVLNRDGGWTYTLDPNKSDTQALVDGATATEVFTYTMTDLDGATSTSTLTITITGSNDAPEVAGTISGERAEGTSAFTLNLLQGASDPDSGDTLSVTNVQYAVDNGTASTTVPTGLVLTDATLSVDPSDAVFNSLAVGQSKVITVTYDVTDGHGGTVAQTATVTITGTNDAPVIAGGPQSGKAFEAGDLHNMIEADVAADHKFEPVVVLDDTIQTLINTHPTAMNVVLQGVLTALQVTNPSATLADAIAQVWDNLDDHYTATNYYNTSVNEQFIRLGVEYVKYLEAGGHPLVDVVAKYEPDVSGNGVPDRVQSMHDNLLGNLNHTDFDSRFSGQLKIDLENLIKTIDPNLDLLTRQVSEVHSGRESNAANKPLAVAFDQAHGLLPVASGQFTATDVDNGDTLTWTIDSANGVTGANGTYGTLTLDGTGKWSYTLDDSRTVTQALSEDDTATETFIVKVSDNHGGFDTETVTITVKGANDAAAITGTSTASLTETNAVLTAAGNLDATDVDGAGSFTEQSDVAGSNGYGLFSIDASGAWTYTTNSANDAFVAGQTYTDSITVATDDGTNQLIIVTITGTNDAPVVTGGVTTSATEDGLPVTVNALANASDADAGSALLVVPPAVLPAGVTFIAPGAAQTIDFESYALGSVVGQNGWTDASPNSPANAIVDVGGTHNQVLRLANDPSSGDFGGPYTPALAVAAGESASGAAVDQFVLSFNFKAVQNMADGSRIEIGLANTASNDRNNFMVLEYTGEPGVGLRLAINSPLANANEWSNNSFDFATGNVTLAANIDPNAWHTVKVVAKFNDGSNNDVLQYYLDGVYIGSGGSFENYFEYARGNSHDASVYAVNKVLFRAGEPAGNPFAADGSGGNRQGFYIDDISTQAASSTAGFQLDPTHADYQHLAQDQTQIVTVNYGVSDGITTTPTTATFTVTGVNDAPVAAADTATATEDGAVVMATVASNDTDADQGHVLTYTLNEPVDGLTLNADGSYSFDPTHATYQSLAAGAQINVVANYTVKDQFNAESHATLTIKVTGTNDAPTMADLTPISINETADYDYFDAIEGAIVATDADANSTLSYGINTGSGTVNSLMGTYGTLTVNANGTYSYAPNAIAINALTGPASETFDVTVSDGIATTMKPLTITINGVNDVPNDIVWSETMGGVNPNVGAPVVAEFSRVGYAIGQLRAEDLAEPSQTVSFQLVGDATGLTANTDGVITVDSAGLVKLLDPTKLSVAASGYDPDSPITEVFPGVLGYSFFVKVTDSVGASVVVEQYVTVAEQTKFDGSTVLAQLNGLDNEFDLTATSGPTSFAGGAFAAADNFVDGGARNDILTTGSGNDVLVGGSGDDTLNAGNGVNQLDGGIGNDVLTAGTGDDWFVGGTGNDTITTGDAVDIVDASSPEVEHDHDVIQYNWTSSSGLLRNDVFTQTAPTSGIAGANVTNYADTIIDFTDGSDKIAFTAGTSEHSFGLGGVGQLSASKLVIYAGKGGDGLAGTADDVLANNVIAGSQADGAQLKYFQDSGELWYDRDGDTNVGVTDIAKVATLTNHAALTHSDILLV